MKFVSPHPSFIKFSRPTIWRTGLLLPLLTSLIVALGLAIEMTSFTGGTFGKRDRYEQTMSMASLEPGRRSSPLAASTATLNEPTALQLDAVSANHQADLLTSDEPANTGLLPSAGLTHPHAGLELPVEEMLIFPEPAAGPNAPQSCIPFDDPLEQVAQDLLQKSRDLDDREDEIEVKSQAMLVIRDQLKEDLDKLNELKDELSVLVEKVDEQEEERLNQVVKVYETMKAKRAAEIFNRLHLSVIMQVATRMREAKLADILASMEPDKAQVITAHLTARAMESNRIN